MYVYIYIYIYINIHIYVCTGMLSTALNVYAHV